jgi:Tol biopolymer transport system component
MEADGTDLFQVTRNNGEDGRGRWSPDGRWIAGAHDPMGDGDIYIVRPDGTGLKYLTQDQWRDLTVCWSPDGKRLAFGSNRGGQADIWVMDRDGTNLVNLTPGPTTGNAPSWSRVPVQ